jgi:flagellar protein FliS
MNFRVLTPTQVARSYKQIELAGQGRSELVISLYDTLIAQLRRARHATKIKDISSRGDAVATVLDLLGELRQSLDFDRAPDLATELDQFYLHATQEVLLAHGRADEEGFSEIVSKFVSVLEVWKEILPSP